MLGVCTHQYREYVYRFVSCESADPSRLKLEKHVDAVCRSRTNNQTFISNTEFKRCFIQCNPQVNLGQTLFKRTLPYSKCRLQTVVQLSSIQLFSTCRILSLLVYV